VLRLEDYLVERILCSPTVRCHQTVQPLARDRLLGIEPLAALGVDGGHSEILELFWYRQLPNTDLPGFVVNRGGEYCFIPSLSALRWLSELDT
jgi:hypothetical protein